MIRLITITFERSRILRGIFRGFFIGLQLKSKQGKLVVLDRSTFLNPFDMQFGSNIFINENCTLEAKGGLIIGNNVIIGTGTQIWTFNHSFSKRDVPIKNQAFVTKPVTIGDDVWIAANCVILPGVTIGKGAVVGAGSIVTKDIPSYAVACGNPAKVIKTRN